MIVNIGQWEYSDKMGGQAGAKVVIHPQTAIAFPEDEGILAKPGESVAIGMKKVGKNIGKLRLGKTYLMDLFAT